jgi:hypothetical protein
VTSYLKLQALLSLCILCWSVIASPLVIRKVSLLLRSHFLLGDFPSQDRGCRPFTRRPARIETPSRALSLSATPRRPSSGITSDLDRPYLFFSSPLFFTSFSPIRISGHILCSFSQVSRPQHHAPPPCITTTSTATTIQLLTHRQLWSHYQSRTLQKFDIYDPVSPLSPSHPWLSRSPP